MDLVNVRIHNAYALELTYVRLIAIMLGRLRITLSDCAKYFFHLTIGIFREPRRIIDEHFYSRRQQDTVSFQRRVERLIRRRAKELGEREDPSLKLKNLEATSKT